jgi:hypothetical protein
MNATDYFSTAIHEASHHAAADSFKIPSYPEVTPGGRSVLFPAEFPGIAGLCHLENPVTKFQSAVISWAGPLGQAMYAETPDWFPPFKPSEKMLRDWFSMVMQQINRLSDGDRCGIRGYKDPWRACRSAFAVVRKNRARIVRLAKCLAATIANADRQADEQKWAGVPRPPLFPASHADFIRLVSGDDAERFEQFLLSRAARHLTNNRTMDIEDAKAGLGAAFDDAFAISMNLQRQLYAGDFPDADGWLRTAKDFQQWFNEPK